MQSLSEYPEKLNSLGEVQRIIGLSLSKIQVGRNQRGGLPLHKNLLVATVLNKARDLYMQETMYMNYKMMTGHQFGMPTSASEGTSSLTNVPGTSNEEEMEEPPEHEDYEEDSESDVEDECEPRSCDLAASPRAAIAASMAYPASTMAAMMMQAAAASVAASSCSNDENGRLTPINPSAIAMQNNMRLHQTNGEVHHSSEEHQSSHHDFAMHGSFQHLHHLSQLHHHHQQQQQQLQQQQEQHQQTAAIVAAHAQAAVVAAAAAVVNHQHLQQQQQQQLQQQQVVNTPVAGSDEGFIDEPDCDCDVRNFSTLETRVPFQYCYHCAPFQSANGRGPTLVPSPSSCPSSLSSSNTSQVEDDSTSTSRSSSLHQNLSSFQTSSQAVADVSSCQQQQQQQCSENNFTIYDMDSKSTERKVPCDEPSRPGTKRRRKTSGPEIPDVPKRRRSSEGSNDLDVGTEEQQPLLSSTASTSETSDSRTEEEEVVHPAFRNSDSNAVGHQAMEIDQITSLVSIFSFGQHIIAVGRGKDNNTTTTTTTTAENVEVTSPETESGSEDKSENKKSTAADEDSDSESDTSSDSGHSSDDHDTSSDKDIKDEDVADNKTPDVVLTKLTRSASTPDLCSASVSASNGAMTPESPLCVEVASV